MKPEYAVLAGAITLFVGVLIFLIRHAANSSKHPCKSDIVFRDSCDPKMQRLEDCIESAIERGNERHAELKEDIGKMDTKIDRLLEK